MSETLTPFHLQAEELGKFLRDDRARDGKPRREEPKVEGPSENVD
jgi:hypothetical protein